MLEKIRSLFSKATGFLSKLGKAIVSVAKKGYSSAAGLCKRLWNRITGKKPVEKDDGVSSYAELSSAKEKDNSYAEDECASAVTREIVAAAEAEAALDAVSVSDDDDDDDDVDDDDDDDDDASAGSTADAEADASAAESASHHKHHFHRHGSKSGSKKSRRRMAEIMKYQSSHNRSLKTRIRVLVLAGIAISVIFTIASIAMFVSDLIINNAYDKMLNIVNSYGYLVSQEENVTGKVLTYDEYEQILDGVHLEDVENSYCYVLHRAGVIQYHPDESKVSKPNKIPELMQVVADLNIGKVPESKCCEYEEDGKTYYCSFYITDIWNTVVVCAEGSELMQPMVNLIIRIVISMLIVAVCAFFITTWVANRITEPITKIIKVINNTSELNLQLPDDIALYLKRADETGQISRAVALMSNSLTDIVDNMENASAEIEDNMIDLEDSSKTINKYCIENSVTAGQLAAGTASVAEKTGNIAENVMEMRDRSGDISREAENCVKATEDISKRAQDLQAATAQAISKTQNVYSEIRNETALALEGLKAVSRINALTDVIVGISDETNLLSLNATIEAAHAGEAGRGFAVVATEISKLAAQSLQTVSDINALIDEINVAVKNISGSVNKTTDFLEQQVLADYDSFNHVGEQYLSDAEFFRSTMGNISTAMADLNTTIGEVTEDVESIKVTMQETSMGVSDISEKSSSVVELTTDNYDLSRSTTNHVGNLKKMLDKFTV